jgi:Tfp pilus assembly PilM family ATPase/Tfp pilus assembly protein PilN
MRVGLNISNSSIQVLSLKGREVKRWGSAALAEGLVRDGLVLQPQAVGEAIDALFKSSRISKENVVVTVAGLSFTYRFLNLPRIKNALLEEAILRAARKEISLPIDELYLSWQPLPGKGDEQPFFVLGVPRNLIDAALQALSAAKIEPYLMDLRPLALARSANRRDAIVVNLQPDSFDIVFITNGIPTVIHSISPRSERATLEDNIRRLADELSKTAAFYQSNHPEGRLDATTPLLLTGELAAEAPVSGLLQAEVEYPVEPLSPPVEFPAELPVASYTASIGLALKNVTHRAAPRGEESGFHDININILSGKYRKSKARPIPAGYLLLGVFLAIAVIFLFPLYQSWNQKKAENAGLEDELNAVSRKVNLAGLVAEETTGKEEAIREILADTEALESAVQSILGNRGVYSLNLQRITEKLPPQTHFTSIEIGDNAITARGETDSVFSVIEYAIALEGQKEFSEVRITRLDEEISIASEVEETETAPEQISVITFEILINLAEG